VTADAVREHVSALLYDPSLRAAARGIQAELAAMPGPERGVDLLERLATERRPLLR
jgi:UDP:flavonoid glycosyltransferase YjiC (YdhE family)